jgi:hypothetical protein
MRRGGVGVMDSQLVGRDVEAARPEGIIERLPDATVALVIAGEVEAGNTAPSQYARARASVPCLGTLSTRSVGRSRARHTTPVSSTEEQTR